MKKITQIIICTFALTAICIYGFAQNLVQGTLTTTGTNSVMVKLRSNNSFSASFSDVAITLQIPTTVAPSAPAATITATPMTAFIPTLTTTTPMTVSTQSGYYTYSLEVLMTGATAYSFVANATFNLFEISFSGLSSATSVRLVNLPDGGTAAPNRSYFYIEAGADRTNEAEMFFGPGATNTGSYTSYSFVPAATVAPVNFLSFAANKVNDNADLRWEVANQTNLTSHFNVERSTDGVNFKGIQEIAANTQNGAASYTMLDENISKLNVNLIYYRIKQVDTDGKFVYSDVKYVKVGNKGGLISANPNPVKDITNLRIEVLENQNATLQLLDANGKQILTESLKLNKGLNTKQFDMSPLAAGVYVIRVVTENDEVLSQKIVKQ
jgi:hypothetical protein